LQDFVILSKAKTMNNTTTSRLTMTKQDLQDLINRQEDCELWIYSTLGKKFDHLITIGIQQDWLVLNGEYVRAAL
jgi:alkylhydroperoxidase/carboxymuconolactone decarboxylase family protein YurZ